MAILYLPFFWLAMGLAWVTGAPMDGYSWPFECCIQLSAICYAILGLWILRKWLSVYFPDKIVAATLGVLAFGTNLFYYVIGHGPMPHAYLFFLLTAFAWLILRFFEKPGWRLAFGIGLVGGLAVLIRPVHIVIWLAPLLYGLQQTGSIAAFLQFFRKHIVFILLALIIPVLLWLPQMAYWKYMTGSGWFWSYHGESFFWTEPKLLSVLVGFRKGWLIYTPLMVLALSGWVIVWKKFPQWRWALSIPFVLSVYAMAAWWCWWFGGSFGMRPMIDFYGWLALGLAAALAWGWQQRKAVRITLMIILLLGLGLNGLQTAQYVKGIIHHDAMTFASWRASLGKFHSDPAYESLLDHPDYEAAQEGDR
jgi:hypothetical protein